VSTPNVPKLSAEPIRGALTDRECAALLGSLIGGLVQSFADAATVRRAVRWWADGDEAWMMLAQAFPLPATDSGTAS